MNDLCVEPENVIYLPAEQIHSPIMIKGSRPLGKSTFNCDLKFKVPKDYGLTIDIDKYDLHLNDTLEIVAEVEPETDRTERVELEKKSRYNTIPTKNKVQLLTKLHEMPEIRNDKDAFTIRITTFKSKPNN